MSLRLGVQPFVSTAGEEMAPEVWRFISKK